LAEMLHGYHIFRLGPRRNFGLSAKFGAPSSPVLTTHRLLPQETFFQLRMPGLVCTMIYVMSHESMDLACYGHHFNLLRFLSFAHMYPSTASTLCTRQPHVPVTRVISHNTRSVSNLKLIVTTSTIGCGGVTSLIPARGRVQCDPVLLVHKRLVRRPAPGGEQALHHRVPFRTDPVAKPVRVRHEACCDRACFFCAFFLCFFPSLRWPSVHHRTAGKIGSYVTGPRFVLTAFQACWHARCRKYAEIASRGADTCLPNWVLVASAEWRSLPPVHGHNKVRTPPIVM